MSRIVIAEDSVHIRNVLAMWMSRNGHDVFPAPDGRVALELLRDQPVDFLVTDLAMPGMDGAELAGVAFGVCPTLRWVFVVSSRCDQHEVLAGLADPRISLFPKPFCPSQLLRELTRVAQTTAAELPDAAGLTPPAITPGFVGDAG